MNYLQTAEGKMALLGLLASVAGALLTWLTLRKKPDKRGLAFGYEVGPFLSSLEQGYANLLDLQSDAGLTGEIKIIRLMLKNSGLLPVATSDFEGPMRFELKQCNRIISVRSTVRLPRHLSPVLRRDGNAVVLEPLLLNPGDKIEFEALVHGGTVSPTLRGRVSGVADFDILLRKAPWWYMDTWEAVCCSVACIAFAFLLSRRSLFLSVVFALVATCLFAAYVLKLRKYKNATWNMFGPFVGSSPD